MLKDAFTIQELMLDVDDGYTIYVQDWGNKDAETPTIFLHGGPGSQVKEKHKAAFDPTIQRVIFFDQRGCGQSTPAGSLENNTTDKLVSDISKIADELNISKFNIHGSSWGSTLALAYAIAHPERVAALVIGGVFTGSKAESDWIDKGLFKTFYPDTWQAYLDRTPKEHQSNPSAFHFDKVINGTIEEQKISGYAYECLEAGVIKLDDRFTPDDFAEYDPAAIRIEVHYLTNGCFMPDRYILDNTDKLTMPIYIVQGRYDMVCPPATAYELHNRLANSKLYWTLSGHHVEHEGQNIFKSIFAGL
ncbi:MAG TPA: alpha/beta fold hydrolase [Candidatus Saccharibacteria bacterium]|nr:alpha/beta fold hydrolase [Candidatus Saccharibacteria bacterium]HRQ98166.1 alpha/beta fold hydrolase [Candidatus Saccharibacteria bacterium]